MNKQPTGFFTNRGDMIYEGDLLRVIREERRTIIGEHFIDLEKKSSTIITSYVIGKVVWRSADYLYYLRDPFISTPFCWDLTDIATYGLYGGTTLDNSYSFVRYRRVEVFGHISDSDVKEKWEMENNIVEKVQAEIKERYNAEHPKINPEADNRGFWSKLWEKFS